MTEAAVMIAFALHLFDTGTTAVEIHPDGEHGKRFDIKGSLGAHGFALMHTLGTTNYGGIYQRNKQTMIVTLKPGIGDIVAEFEGQVLVAECKGGVVNTRHAGQVSRLRRGLCEAVGLLMARPLNGGRNVAVIPATEVVEKLARKMLPRIATAGIEVALVQKDGRVDYVHP